MKNYLTRNYKCRIIPDGNVAVVNVNGRVIAIIHKDGTITYENNTDGNRLKALALSLKK